MAEDNLAKVKALIKAGANANIVNDEGMTALDKAVDWNQEDCVEFLREYTLHHLE